MLEESVRGFREVGDDWGMALALIPLADVALLDGDLRAARAMHEEVLAHARTIDDDHMTAQAHDQLALDAMLSMDPASARRHLRSAAALHASLHDHEGTAYCLEGFAGLALAVGRPDLAARLMGAAEHARRLVGVAVWPFMRPLLARLEAFVRMSLPDGGFDEAFGQGLLLDLEPALELAATETAAASAG
jgi:hypothetical protein